MAGKTDVDEIEFTLESTEGDGEADEAVSQSRALSTVDSAVPRLHVGEPAYKQYAPEMLALIAKTIMPTGYSLPELYMGLELAATYGLDPFTKELWLVRMKDGGPVQAMVGRDGLLAVAERHKDFVGFRNMEVWEKDDFFYTADPVQRADGTWTHVSHSFKPAKDRGQLLGAYAEVYRRGRPPVYFWAPMDDYYKDSGPWKKQKTAMIRKCALANALRLAYRISGLYIADEQTGYSLELPVEPAQAVEEGTATFDWGEDTELAAWLSMLFQAAGYTEGKQKLLLSGASGARDALEAIAEQVEQEIRGSGKEPPERPSLVGEVVDEEPVSE